MLRALEAADTPLRFNTPILNSALPSPVPMVNMPQVGNVFHEWSLA